MLHHHGSFNSRHQYTHNLRTDHTLIMASDIGNITADHRSASIHTVTEAAALEGTPCALLPATAAAHTTLQQLDTPIIPHDVIPRGIVAPHPTLAISPTQIHRLVPIVLQQLLPCSIRISAQEGQTIPKNINHPHKPHCQKLSPSRIPLQTLHWILTVTLIL